MYQPHQTNIHDPSVRDGEYWSWVSFQQDAAADVNLEKTQLVHAIKKKTNIKKNRNIPK